MGFVPICLSRQGASADIQHGLPESRRCFDVDLR